MQKRLKLIVITILVMFMSIAITNSKVEAATVTISPSKTSYVINGSKPLYRYVESKGNYNNIYCLNYGGVLNNGSVYTVNADLYNMSADQIKNVFGSTENYNKALWVIDNMIITQNQSKDEIMVMVKQLEEALHSETALNAVRKTYNVPNLKAGDMDNVINHIYSNGKYDVYYAIQQSVLWTYTVNRYSFNGLSSIGGGIDLEGKYYKWMYTGLKAEADTKGNYNSPNKNKNIASIINNITMDSKSATIDVNNRRVGPFVINGYNNEIMTKKEYAVTINGTKLDNSDFSYSFDGRNVYFTIKNTSYDLSAAKVDIAMNIKATSTTGSYLFKQYSQNIVSLNKDVVVKHLSGSTEDTEFDLRLLKNITGVWSVDNSTARLKCDLESQNLSSRKLERISSLQKGDTTENWYLNKYPISVATGDIVRYNITIANEGNLDGYATKITDYIADGLELVSKDELVKLGIINQDAEYYGWTTEKSENGFTAVSTTYLADKKLNAYNKNTNAIDTKYVQIYCKVKSSNAGELLKNVAEITGEKATNLSGKEVSDRDSTPGNIKFSDLSSTWKGNSGNKDIERTNIKEKYSYPGKEDDDDFETVKVQNFDMALTKEITSIEYPNGNKVDLTRLVNVDKTKLNNKTSTTATYNMDKSLITVTKDSIITYTITVYNEGNVDAYAWIVTDYLPKGLELYATEVDGVNYEWKVTEKDNGTSVIQSIYLHDKKIDAFNGNQLSSASIKVKCKVTSDETNRILTNVAEISDYRYYPNGKEDPYNYVSADKENVDVDSVQDNIGKLMSKESTPDKISSYEQKVKSIDQEKNYISKEKTNYEDDDDFENVIIGNKSLDLALRKSISAVNGQTVVNDYNLTENRLPKITGETALSALATGNAEYYHNKEAIEVNQNDEITYTIRVYNEGNEDDYCGYAKEITDYLPEGLTFVKIDDTSTAKWQTTSKEGDSTVKLKYIGNETIYNNSLFEIYKRNYTGNTDMTNLYQTVSIICKVNGTSGYLTNRAEISDEVATDENGTIIDGVKDRDSTPGSLSGIDLNLKYYYNYYNVKYGINDTYVDFYVGEENGKIEDDIDFETVLVKSQTVDINGTKTWNDEGNKDKTRPEKITIYLLANGKQVDAKEISEKDGWKYSFTGLAKYDDNKQEIKYTVDESEVEKYTKQVNGYDIINTYTPPETIDISGTKTWNDEGNKDKTRPEKITIYLLANGKQVDAKEISEKDGWKYSFTGLAKYDDNKQEIKYTVDESEVEKYTKQVNGYDIINTYTPPETIDISGTKTWNDEGNKDKTRPEKITIYLLANGKQVDAKEISEKDGWKYSFTGLAKYDDNKQEIKYTVDESEVEKYTKQVNGYDIINTYTPPETIDISGTKTWNDEGNKDKTRPEKITIYLLANGKQVDAKEISEKDGWKYSFTGLAKYDDNKQEIKYTVDESEVEKYTKQVNGYDIINTYTPPETIDISGTKTWNDEGNKDKTRPEKITIYLLANGKQVDAKEISEKDGWKYSFTGLAKYDDNKQEIKYTVDESEVEKYTKQVNGYDIINTYTPPETIDISGTKTWNDEGNKDKTRPEKITIYLLANGKQVDAKEISEKDGWKYSFTGLAKYDDNKQEIKYTVDESEVEKYTKQVNGYDIVNTYTPDNPPTPETIDISGTKTWNDANNKDGIRPKAIKVKLLANGKEKTSVITTEEQEWKYSFTKLPKYDDDGKEIKYTVDEENVRGYTKKIDGYDITNTHTPTEKLDFSLRKFITEINSVAVNPSRAPQVDVTNLANGTSTTATYNHPKDAKTVNTGDVVTYTIRVYNEGEVDGYVSLIKDEIPEGLQYITNDATNTTYGWKMLDADGKETSDVSKAKYVTTDYLSKEKSEDNLIAKFNKETKQLSHKDVKVSFKVVSEDTTGKEIINHAQISKETDSNGKTGTDIDSTPDKWIDGEDDQDIEKVKLTYADLALRKFITKINNEVVNPNRAPQVDVTNLANGTSTTATYNHPKNTVSVSRNDVVVYTLRIYNEGTRDAVAALVKDNIPAGLQFIPSDDLNKKYNWKMLDENNNETTKVSEAKYVVTDYLSNSVIKAYDSTTMDTLDYKDVEVAFKVIAEESTKNEITNYAQISKETDSNGNTIKDRDSTPDEWIDGEDDQDIEKVKLTYADLALRKFITELNSSEVNPSRAPQVDVTNLANGTSTTATYNHPKDPVEVRENDIVTYTLRIYNEGTKNVYASLVEDDIPEGLEFITDNEINKQYKWKILDENRNETTDISKAKYIVTDYLANDLIKAFDPQTMSTLDYRDVKVSFKVKAPTEKDGQIINYAQIIKETDDSGKDVKDRDSTPGKWVDGEDDQDTEIIKLKYFDLALQKWVSKAIVIEDGKEKVTETRHNGDMKPEPVVKVDLKKSKVKNVVVKFEYQIRVENQGQIAGYAKEVSDYIPQGLKFVKDDNQNWREVDGKIVTNQLENTLLQPGESTTISVILTWINDSNNLGLKTNIAEISEDADDHGNPITDIDSTPNNQVDGEDDQDNAPVIITVRTGETTIYTSVIIAVIAIIGAGVYGIKKYVLK